MLLTHWADNNLHALYSLARPPRQRSKFTCRNSALENYRWLSRPRPRPRLTSTTAAGWTSELRGPNCAEFGDDIGTKRCLRDIAPVPKRVPQRRWVQIDARFCIFIPSVKLRDGCAKSAFLKELVSFGQIFT